MSPSGGGARAARGRSRDLLVRALYQWQIHAMATPDLLGQYESDPAFARVDAAHFRRILEFVLANVEVLDQRISAYAARSLDQLDLVGRAVLWMALAEFEIGQDVPPKVAINEAINLAKRYGATDVFKFVNAVLDKVARAQTAPKS